MIKKFGITLAMQNGEEALRVPSYKKPTSKQLSEIKAVKPEIIAELKRAEAEKKAEREATEKATVTFLVVGWESHEISVDTRYDVDEQLRKIADYYSDDMTFESAKKAYEKAIGKEEEIKEAQAEEEKAEKEKAEIMKSEKSSMNVEVIKMNKRQSEEHDPFATVKITDPKTGESAQFTCRNIFDFGFVINPDYPLADGLEPGGILMGDNWQTWKDEGGWYSVRKATEFEKKATAYLRKFSPLSTSVRM